ncbi:MAG: mechanosensitive ion channel domain-containing protein, partial [Pseudomonadota bacterium]
LFYLLSRTPLPKTQTLTSGVLTGIRPEFVKLPVLIIAVFLVATSLLGYVALARYLAGQVLETGAALMLIAISFVAIRAISLHADHAMAAGTSNSGDDELQGFLALTPDQQARVVKVVTIALYGVLFALAPVLVLFSFGFSWIEISSIINRALFGFEVGGVRISLLQVGIAVGLFAAILLLTKTVQTALSTSVLRAERTDQGLANSIKTGIGYAGFGVAALVGLSYAGLDITNLAIVAGALSVGIGFGLQSIVNNFVSGLILLVERPIKVGDWIQAGNEQGYVRRISVRSTEIETFDRASVIVPNSELITGTVTNLTHRNTMGRLKINVGVGYNSDPEQVQAILLKCAQDCDLVARHPPPFVVFEDFGDSALLFSVRAYLADINRGLSAQTALRTAIFKELKFAQIEIPFPQRDLHLRDLDGVKHMLARAAEEKMRQAMPQRQSGKSDPGSATDPEQS